MLTDIDALLAAGVPAAIFDLTVGLARSSETGQLHTLFWCPQIGAETVESVEVPVADLSDGGVCEDCTAVTGLEWVRYSIRVGHLLVDVADLRGRPGPSWRDVAGLREALDTVAELEDSISDNPAIDDALAQARAEITTAVADQVARLGTDVDHWCDAAAAATDTETVDPEVWHGDHVAGLLIHGDPRRTLERRLRDARGGRPSEPSVVVLASSGRSYRSLYGTIARDRVSPDAYSLLFAPATQVELGGASRFAILPGTVAAHLVGHTSGGTVRVLDAAEPGDDEETLTLLARIALDDEDLDLSDALAAARGIRAPVAH